MTPSQSSTVQMVRVEDLENLRYHAQAMLAHRDGPTENADGSVGPCSYWTGRGCQVSMAHHAEDILRCLDLIQAEWKPS